MASNYLIFFVLVITNTLCLVAGVYIMHKALRKRRKTKGNVFPNHSPPTAINPSTPQEEIDRRNISITLQEFVNETYKSDPVSIHWSGVKIGARRAKILESYRQAAMECEGRMCSNVEPDVGGSRDSSFGSLKPQISSRHLELSGSGGFSPPLYEADSESSSVGLHMHMSLGSLLNLS